MLSISANGRCQQRLHASNCRRPFVSASCPLRHTSCPLPSDVSGIKSGIRRYEAQRLTCFKYQVAELLLLGGMGMKCYISLRRGSQVCVFLNYRSAGCRCGRWTLVAVAGLNGSVKLSFTVDAAVLKDIEDLKEKLGSRNLATVVYTAVLIVRQLYEYQRSGYEVAVRKPGRRTVGPIPSLLISLCPRCSKRSLGKSRSEQSEIAASIAAD